MDSSKPYAPVPMQPGLHSVQAGAAVAQQSLVVASANATVAGVAFPAAPTAAAASASASVSAFQTARDAAALRESYLKNERKQKCLTCGNTARARCPFRQCRTCCMKSNKSCYIHVVKQGRPELTPNGSIMMGTSFDPRYQSPGSMTIGHASPQFRQPAPPTYVPPGAGVPMRYPTPTPGMTYGSQFYRPAAPGAQVPTNWSKVTPGPQVAPQTREQMEYMRLKSYRAATQAMQKEANMLNAWRLRKLKEYDETEAALEDEAFDRYAKSMSWLEEVFSVDGPALDGLSDDGHLLVEDVQVQNGSGTEQTVVDGSKLADGLRVRLALNPKKKEGGRQRLKRAIERNLQKLKARDESVEHWNEDDDYNLPVLPGGSHAKKFKTTSKEGRDCIKRMDAFDFVVQKVNDIKSRDDIWRSFGLYKDSFGPGIGRILPHRTQTAEDFLGCEAAIRNNVESAKEPVWLGSAEGLTKDSGQGCSNGDCAAENGQQSTAVLADERGGSLKTDIAEIITEASVKPGSTTGQWAAENVTPESKKEGDASSRVQEGCEEVDMQMTDAAPLARDDCGTADALQGGGVSIEEGAPTPGPANEAAVPMDVSQEATEVGGELSAHGQLAVEPETVQANQQGDGGSSLQERSVEVEVQNSDASELARDDSRVADALQGETASIVQGAPVVGPAGAPAVPKGVLQDGVEAGQDQAPSKNVSALGPQNLQAQVASKVKPMESVEGFKVPELAKPRYNPSADSSFVQPQNVFPAICVCAWRRVDMNVPTAEKVLQYLSQVEGLEEL